MLVADGESVIKDDTVVLSEEIVDSDGLTVGDFETPGDIEVIAEPEETKEYDWTEDEDLENLAEGLTDVDIVLERDTTGLPDKTAEREEVLELDVEPDADFIADGVRILLWEFIGDNEAIGVNDGEPDDESLSIDEYVVYPLIDAEGLTDWLAEDESDVNDELEK